MELDDLKSIWGSIKEENKFDKEQIFNMLKKKSSTTIKQLFIFTFCEFIIFIFYNTYVIITGESFFNENVITLVKKATINNYEITYIFNITITILFLVIAYRYYKNISLNQSVSNLIKKIVNFRKLINLFILTNIVSLIIFSAPFYYELGKSIYLSKHLKDINPNENSSLFGWITIFISCFFIVVISGIYYLIIHFLFLKKLKRNLKDLREIK